MVSKVVDGTTYTTSTDGVTGAIPDNAVFALLRLWNGYDAYQGSTFIPLGWLSNTSINHTFRVEYGASTAEIIMNPNTRRYTLKRISEGTFPVVISFY